MTEDYVLTFQTFQIHNLFSLLSLQVVYVTSLGRLTGLVALKDVSINYSQLDVDNQFFTFH